MHKMAERYSQREAETRYLRSKQSRAEDRPICTRTKVRTDAHFRANLRIEPLYTANQD